MKQEIESVNIKYADMDAYEGKAVDHMKEIRAIYKKYGVNDA